MNEIKMKDKDLLRMLQEKNKEISELKTLHEKEIAELQERIRRLEQRDRLFNTDEIITKQIIRLSASGYNIKNIFDILTTKLALDVDLDTIKITVDTLDNLPDSMRKYYLECKKEFKDQTSIDSNFFKNTIYKKYMMLENAISYELAKAQEANDTKMVSQCTSQLMSIYEKMTNAFSKNGINMEGDKTVEDLMSSYETVKETSKVINISRKVIEEETEVI